MTAAISFRSALGLKNACMGAIIYGIQINELAFLMSKLLKIQFQDKTNPLNNLGILFSINQMLYLLIAMWIYPTIPNKMLMVLAIIFGAHLLPYSWLYNSRAYLISSIVISILALLVGINFKPFILASVMLAMVAAFCITLILENHQLD